MHRFFVDYKIEGHHVEISDKNDVKHIIRALRVQLGEKLEVCDLLGEEYIVEVESLEETVLCKVLEKNAVKRESNISIDLYQGLAKGSKMETIIQKCVELGVRDIIPLNTKRVIVKLDSKGEKKKLERWQKIADEAAKQSKRSYLPQVKDMIHIKDLPSCLETYDLVLVAYELETSRSLKTLLDKANKKVAIVIGPEGGFETGEIDELVQVGVHSVSLGPRILRTETAGMMLLSIIQYEIGDVSQ